MCISPLIPTNGSGFAREFVGFFVQAVFPAECGEFVVPFFLADVSQPADLCCAFWTGVDRAAVGFGKMIRAAHEAFPFCAMAHREHMAGLVGGDL